MTDWLAALEAEAPDPVACYRALDVGLRVGLRREIRRRAGTGSADAMAEQLAVLATAFTAIVRDLPDVAFGMPGREADWTVAQTIGHDANARAGIALAAARAASGTWPEDAPTVIPGVPGRADATRQELVDKVAISQRIVERSARTVLSREAGPCPLDHPMVGRLRCGEWLLFAGVHDLMHLEQLHDLAAVLASGSRGATV